MAINGVRVIGIMAADPNGVIGDKGKLPWRYPDEKEWYHNTIRGSVLIMGRKTFEAESIKILNECKPIVFSRLIMIPRHHDVMMSRCHDVMMSYEHLTPVQLNLPKAFGKADLISSGERAERTESYVSTRDREEIKDGFLKGAGYHPQGVVECTVIAGLDELSRLFADLRSTSVCYLIGGAEIARLFLQHNLIDEFLLTRIHSHYPGDTRLDLTLFKDWQEEVLRQTRYYSICRLTNHRPNV